MKNKQLTIAKTVNNKIRKEMAAMAERHAETNSGRETSEIHRVNPAEAYAKYRTKLSVKESNISRHYQAGARMFYTRGMEEGIELGKKKTIAALSGLLSKKAKSELAAIAL